MNFLLIIFLTQDTDIRETAKAVNFILTKLITTEEDNEESNDALDLAPVVEVLLKHLVHTAVPTKVAVLQWIYHLHTKIPDRVIMNKILTLFSLIYEHLSTVVI